MRNYDLGGYVDGRSGHHVGEGWFVAGGADLPAAGGQAPIHEPTCSRISRWHNHGMRGKPIALFLAGSARHV